jgi:hypothetical protein
VLGHVHHRHEVVGRIFGQQRTLHRGVLYRTKKSGF